MGRVPSTWPDPAPWGVLPSQCPPPQSWAQDAALGVLLTNRLSPGRRAPWPWTVGVHPVVHRRGSATGSVLPSAGEGEGLQAMQGLLVPFSGLHVVPPAPPGLPSPAWSTGEDGPPPSGLSCPAGSRVQGSRPRPLSPCGLPATVSACRPCGNHTCLPGGLVESLCACVWQSLGHLGVAPSLPRQTMGDMALEDYTPSPPLSLGFRCPGLWFWTTLSPLFLLSCDFLSFTSSLGPIFLHRALISESSFSLQADTAFPFLRR